MALSPEEHKQAHDLILRITRGFGVGKKPRGQKLIESNAATDDPAGTAALAKALRGRTWDQVPLDWLRDKWSSFIYLTPEGYHHYLPSLLCGALTDLKDDGNLVHRVTFSLVPSYWHIYYRGADRKHEARVATLAPEEYDLVCEFLAWIQRLRYPFLAAEAMRWGWSTRDTPHHAVMHSHYERMFGHTWPDLEGEAGAVASQIKSAFEGAAYPGDDRLSGSSQGDDGPQYALEFRGQDWRTLHPEFLSYNYAAPSFFTAEGLAYFLPAFLLADVYGGECDFDPVDTLARHIGKRGNARLEVFDRTQCKALIAYLRYRHALDDWGSDRKNIERALEIYWLPRIA